MFSRELHPDHSPAGADERLPLAQFYSMRKSVPTLTVYHDSDKITVRMTDISYYIRGILSLNRLTNSMSRFTRSTP